MEKVEQIDIKKIRDFSNHPFKIMNDQNYIELKESIINNGVLMPVILRKIKETKETYLYLIQLLKEDTSGVQPQ